MQRYVEQLVGMLQEAHFNKPQQRYLELPEEMECLRDIIDYEKSIERGEEYTIESIFGIEQIYFPPENRLSDEQVKSLLDAILELWRVFHYAAVFRKGEFNDRQKYTQLVAQWKEKVPKMRGSNGTYYMELYNHDLWWDENDMCYLSEDEYWKKYPIPHFDWEDEDIL